MIDGSVFTVYDVVIGAITGVGVGYFLFLKPTVVEYHRYLMLTVLGFTTLLVGGPLSRLFVPNLVHWIHGFAALLVIYGLYNPLENDLRRDAWADVLLKEPGKVRREANWMLPIDDAILGLFHSTELILTPAIIGYNIDYSREEVNRRLSELEERGLVTKIERGKYRITDLGKQYIEGSVSSGILSQYLSNVTRGENKA